MHSGTIPRCLCALLASGLLLFAAPATADERPARSAEQILNTRGSLTLRDVTLSQALFTISESWHVNLLFGNSIEGSVNGVFRDATLREVLALAFDLGVPEDRLVIDPTLARGLDYYTGPVYEAVLDELPIGSVAGGGRYDGLVGMFGKNPVPAVGVSLGLERLITVLDELGHSDGEGATADVLVTVFDPADTDTRAASVRCARALRAGGVRAELYLDDRRLKAQLKHAGARGYRFVAIIGPDEAKTGAVTLKNLADGSQQTMPVQDAASILVR